MLKKLLQLSVILFIICSGLLACSFIDSACESDADCTEPLVCINQVCSDKVECKTDQECVDKKLGKFCVTYLCTDCRGDDDCETGMICKDRKCGHCKDNQDCKSGFVCNFEAGQDKGLCKNRNQCKTDQDCPEGLKCINEICSKPVSCKTNIDCPNGMFCINQVCNATKPCKSVIDCPQGWQCVDGKCTNETPCSSEKDCPEGQVCKDGLCKGCFSNVDCVGENRGYVCIEAKCVPCTSNEQCPSGQKCISGRCDVPECTTNLQCDNGFRICDLEKYMCRKCDNDVECGTGRTCDKETTGNCIVKCTKDSECTNKGEICVNTICVPGCRRDEDCSSGRICDDGNNQCRPGCRYDYECDKGQICDRKNNAYICKKPPSCNTDADCPQGYFCDVDNKVCIETGSYQDCVIEYDPKLKKLFLSGYRMRDAGYVVFSYQNPDGSLAATIKNPVAKAPARSDSYWTDWPNSQKAFYILRKVSGTIDTNGCNLINLKFAPNYAGDGTVWVALK